MVEGGGLENRCAARYRGFESPLLRPGTKNTGKNPYLGFINITGSSGDSNRSVAAIQPKAIALQEKFRRMDAPGNAKAGV